MFSLEKKCKKHEKYRDFRLQNGMDDRAPAVPSPPKLASPPKVIYHSKEGVDLLYLSVYLSIYLSIYLSTFKAYG